jgi:hypothetical protein
MSERLSGSSDKCLVPEVTRHHQLSKTVNRFKYRHHSSDPSFQFRLALQAFEAPPEHLRRFSLAAFPLVDHGLAGRADFGGQLLLAKA